MNKYISIVILSSFAFMKADQKERTLSHVFPRVAAMVAIQNNLKKDIERPVKEADGIYNLLSEDHFQTLIQAIVKQQTGNVALPASFTFKIGDVIRTKKLTVLLPGNNREYSIAGDKIVKKTDPTDPHYQLHTLTAGTIKIIGCHAECQPNEKGQQILVSKKTEEYLLTLSK